MHWFHLDRVLVGDIADAWVPELAPRYGDHKLNWWMITQNLALNCSTLLESIWCHELHMVGKNWV
jgi:hypothetical protein